MLTISTIAEALAELERLTGHAWTDSELFDVATGNQISLHAAPPITASTAVHEWVDGEGLVTKYQMGEGYATLAVLFPHQVAQLWISGETKTVHPSDHDRHTETYHWFTEPVRVTREQVRISAGSLTKVLDCWRKSRPQDDGAAQVPTEEAADIDYSLLATREQLVKAFGTFTGMDQSWFKSLKDTPALKNARKVAGRSGKNSTEPFFCPYAVMLWLVGPTRKKGKSISELTAWRMLKAHFPKVHAQHEAGDPNAH